MLLRRLALSTAGLLALLPASAYAAPVTIPEPVAPVIPSEGTGLCIASAISTTPQTDFGFLNQGNYSANMNTFMEAHKMDRVESVIRTVFDLSNNNSSGLQSSYGDFIDVNLPACQTGGCDFFVNDTLTSFGTRIRGYFNVTSNLVNQPIHFGLYGDDAISLTFFDKQANIYPVMIRPPQLGIPTWRLTETVTFQQPGLYPLEMLYVEIAEHAAVEMSYFIGSFTDFESPANQVPVIKLSDAGFTLFPHTSFFQTVSGSPSFADLDKCQQCDRQFVNLPGNNGCLPGYYCNEAALCAPCDTAIFCGPTCSPCGGTTPFCININGQNECAQCRDDSDCKAGYSCDQATHICNECNTDDDCERGKVCDNHSCVTCDTASQCAGNSCNCCPRGSNGKDMYCAPIEENGTPVCVECLINADCPTGVCDVLSGHCVDELPDHAKNDCCGDNCVQCPADHPFCLPGPIGTACAQCRWDLDCPAGNFCLSGACRPCTQDRHCGERCTSCGGDTPFCLDGQTADRSSCVRCLDDTHCLSGACNTMTNECEPSCMMSCAPETPYCDGQKCVECYADTQCPCNGTCNLLTNRCTTSCKGNGDCLGNEHCRWNDDAETKSCALGPMPGEVACGGTLASACDGTIGKRGDEPPPAGGVLMLGALALLGRLRRRGRS